MCVLKTVPFAHRAGMTSVKAKRKQWDAGSMEEASKAVKSEQMSLREAARKYNVPVETLRRRTAGLVSLDCRPGPPTILTSEEETRLAQYCIAMADMGFGLTREGVMAMAYAIVDKTGRDHPFKEGYAGRGWYEGFMARQAILTLRTPQALSYARAVASSKETIDDFFAKLGAIFGRLNLIAKPSLIFNADESGVSIVHRPAKVVAQIGRHNVPSLTSADRGKTHTILACVSASGQVLPPFMVYPRKRPVPEKLKEGAYPNTVFCVSESGWITKDLFFEWFKMFTQRIPPARPVLLVLDGHGSHITIEVIEYARSNNIHMLCLPSHTSHILQPLDVGVFKSFKSFFSKACRQYMAKNVGRVITEDILASVVGSAIAQSHTPLNILGGFKKAGIYPFNPGEVIDRQLAPSKALKKPETQSFSPDQIKLFEQRFEEGYDVPDPEYLAWRSAKHPSPGSVSSEASTAYAATSSSTPVSIGNTSHRSSEEVLNELLTLPQPPSTRSGRPRKKGVNEKALELTDDSILRGMKEKEVSSAEAKKKKEENRIERERRVKERLEKKERRKLEQEQKRQERAKQKEKKSKEKIFKKLKKKSKPISISHSSSPTVGLCSLFSELDIEEDNGQCENCGMFFKDEQSDERFWVCCDQCDGWYCFVCHKLSTKDNVPDEYCCSKCT